MKLYKLARQYYKTFMSNELSNRFIHLLSIDILIKISGLALMYVYLKLMSPQEYGIYGIIVNLIGSVGLFMNLGLYIAQTTFFNDYKENPGKLIFNINIVLIIILVFVYIIFYYSLVDYKLLYYLIGDELTGFSLPRFRLWIWIGITTQIFITMMSNYLVMSKRKIRILQIFNASRVLLTNIFTIWAVYHFNEDKAYIRTKYSIIMDAFVAIPFLFYYYKLIKIEIDFKLIIKSLTIGLPTMVSAIIGSLYGLMDRNILLKNTDAYTLGVYTYAYTLAGNLWVFLQAFLSAFWPGFLEENVPAKSFKSTVKVTKKIITLLLLVSIGLYIFAWIIDITGLIKMNYRESLNFLPVMLVTQIILSFGTIMSNYYIYFKKTYLQVVVSSFSLFLNWQFCLLFIPLYHTWGAVFATLITSCLTTIIHYTYAMYSCKTILIKP